MKILESSLSFSISKITRPVPFSFSWKQIYSQMLPTFHRLQYLRSSAHTPRLIASGNTLILFKINANLDIRIWVVKRFLRCNLPQRKLQFSSWEVFCQRNNHYLVHKFPIAWVLHFNWKRAELESGKLVWQETKTVKKSKHWKFF